MKLIWKSDTVTCIHGWQMFRKRMVLTCDDASSLISGLGSSHFVIGNFEKGLRLKSESLRSTVYTYFIPHLLLLLTPESWRWIYIHCTVLYSLFKCVAYSPSISYNFGIQSSTSSSQNHLLVVIHLLTVWIDKCREQYHLIYNQSGIDFFSAVVRRELNWKVHSNLMYYKLNISMLGLFLFIFSVWLTVLSGSYSTNQLNGQHLRVIWVIYINLTIAEFPVKIYWFYQPRWSGNQKGLSGPLKGGVVLEYLSARLNFT